MTQTGRDRVVALKKADKGLITQRQTAQELKMKVSELGAWQNGTGWYRC